MPTELRRIVFSDDELREAIVIYNRKSRDKLPPGDILCCDISEDKEISVTLRVMDPVEAEAKTINLGTSYLGACLVYYCIHNKIPMPKSANKLLQVIGSNLALNVTKDAREQKLFEIEPAKEK